jgi:hypothetical protein
MTLDRRAHHHSYAAVGTRSPHEWLEADGPMTWRSKGIAQAVTLKPFYKTEGRYTVYWQTV